ncbi:MAG: hypothetical protein P8N52_06745 [Crocinitomicaceae bacterium]|nr:hypothetical protein [Crocinitomicaceae bacterium]
MKQLLFFFSMLSFVGFSQDSTCIQIKLSQNESGEAIRNAAVLIKYADTTLSGQTKSKGEFTVKIPKGVLIDLEFTHLKYKTYTTRKKISNKYTAKDTVFLSYKMDYIRVQNLDEVVVAAPGVPLIYFGSPKLHVSDFELMKNGDVLLLTYPKRLKKGSELLIWDGQKIKGRFEVPELAEELQRDYRENPHVICKEHVYGVHISGNEIALSSLEKSYFLTYLAPILDTIKSKMYFSNFNTNYPAFDYYAFDQLDSSYTKILNVQDDLMMELYRSEYKWVDVRTKLWAKNKELQTGVDAEVWVGSNYFTNSIYYKALYAPMFHRNDTLLVFDYYKDKLFKFDADGVRLDSVSIYHHYDKKHTGWDGNLIQDRATRQVYATYDRAGYRYLGWVNTKTGEIRNQVKLEYRYAHNITVHNNHVYYIYRPFESAQKKYLYKERLPYSF